MKSDWFGVRYWVGSLSYWYSAANGRVFRAALLTSCCLSFCACDRNPYQHPRFHRPEEPRFTDQRNHVSLRMGPLEGEENRKAMKVSKRTVIRAGGGGAEDVAKYGICLKSSPLEAEAGGS